MREERLARRRGTGKQRNLVFQLGALALDHRRGRHFDTHGFALGLLDGLDLLDHLVGDAGREVQRLHVGDGDAQDRGWPGDRGLYLSGGWEVIARAGLIERIADGGARRVRRQAGAVVDAALRDIEPLRL